MREGLFQRQPWPAPPGKICVNSDPRAACDKIIDVNLGIDGRIALVTGASSGIGRGIARALAAEGARTILIARREDRLRQLRDEITDAGGPEPVVMAQDMISADAPRLIADRAGPVEIVVNNAGGSRPFGRDGAEAEWEEAMTLNFTRHRQVTQRLLGPMIAAGWGRVINITGRSEPDGVNGGHIAKAAMHAWAKGLSREVGPHGVTVNSVQPGKIMSDQIEHSEDLERRYREQIPVGEAGQPSDIANLVCFLASPLARYITGAVIPVDGGLRRYQFLPAGERRENHLGTTGARVLKLVLL
jgi:3-oxoacyl-[acyl-carrier protein] reductase